MKVIKRLLLYVILVLLMILPTSVLAEDVNVNDFTYTLSNDYTTLMITGYKGSGGIIEVPSMINNKKVSTLEEGAFSGNTSITSIRLPETITKIQPGAFNGCDNLISIEVSENNTRFTSVGGILFDTYKSILYVYPSGKLDASYVLPSTVTSIYGCAFYNCKNLTNIQLSTDLLSLGTRAFFGCSSLTTMQIPNKVNYIPNSTFDQCTNLTAIEISDNNSTFSSKDGILFNKQGNTLLIYPRGKAEANYYVPNNVECIGEYAFYECNNLTSITLPDGLTRIGNNAFNYCSQLDNIKIPKGIKKIESSAFSNCISLSRVEFEEGLLNIDYNAYENCSSLVSIILPKSLMQINSYAFKDCNNLRLIYFKGNAPTFLYDAFINVVATVCYPENNSTWKNDIMNDYGGTLHWVNFILEYSDIKTIDDQVYSGSAINPAFEVTYGDKILEQETDYTVDYSNNINVGTATITITGKGKYGGSKRATFRITKKSFNEITISDVADVTYTGSAFTPTVEVKHGSKLLVQDADYTVSYSDNTKVGTASITVMGKGNYDGTKIISFQIKAPKVNPPVVSVPEIKEHAISQATISDIKNVIYSGKAITPVIVIKDQNKVLTENMDYTLIYSDNINVGIATIIITGKGYYTGTKTVTFQIERKAITEVKVSEIKDTTYTGKAISPFIKVIDGSKKLKRNMDYTVIYRNNRSVGKATITIKGKGNYTGTLTKTFCILPKAPKLKGKSLRKSINQINITKITGAHGYVIYRATKENGIYKKVAVQKELAYLDKNAKKDKTYYYKVRAYNEVNKKQVVGNYSKVIKIKTK